MLPCYSTIDCIINAWLMTLIYRFSLQIALVWMMKDALCSFHTSLYAISKLKPCTMCCNRYIFISIRFQSVDDRAQHCAGHLSVSSLPPGGCEKACDFAGWITHLHCNQQVGISIALQSEITTVLRMLDPIKASFHNCTSVSHPDVPVIVRST